MKKDQYGVWEIVIPPKADGSAAIPHDSKIKVSPIRLIKPTLSALQTPTIDTPNRMYAACALQSACSNAMDFTP